jgi:hypothetical protein
MEKTERLFCRNYYNICNFNRIGELNLDFKHTPVMLNECIENLNIKPNGIYVDGTLRRCGT